MLESLTRKQAVELFYGYKDNHGNTLIKSAAFQELLDIAKPDTDSDTLKYLFTRLSLLNGYNPEKLMKKGKATEDVAEIRNIIGYVLYHTPSLNLSFKIIADLFNKDGSTTQHGIKVIESEMTIYGHIRYKVQKVKAQLEELMSESGRKTA